MSEPPDLSWLADPQKYNEVVAFVDWRLHEIDALGQKRKAAFVEHVVRCACGVPAVEVVPVRLPNGTSLKALRFWHLDQLPLEMDELPPDASPGARGRAAARAMRNRKPSFRRDRSFRDFVIVFDWIPERSRSLIKAACDCRPTPYLLNTNSVLRHEITVVGISLVDDDTPDD